MTAGRPPNDGTAYLATITVRLHPHEKERLQADSSLAGVSMGELVRRQYFNRPILANADQKMIKELRRLGGLLKHVFVQSGGLYSADTANAIFAVKTYIEKLSK